jgi:hypothetical protein
MIIKIYKFSELMKIKINPFARYASGIRQDGIIIKALRFDRIYWSVDAGHKKIRIMHSSNIQDTRIEETVCMISC